MDITERSMPEPMTGCLIWLGSTTASGYGRFRSKMKVLRAHRKVYFDVHFEADRRGRVAHTCNTPSCVNIDHLYYLPPGTAAPRGPINMPKATANCNGRLTDEMVESILLSRETDTAEALRHGISRQYVGDLRRGRFRKEVFARLRRGLADLANTPPSNDVI